MRALIRNKEVIIEPFSPWVQDNIAFLTGIEVDEDGKPIKGDGWTLVENYVPPEPESEPITEDSGEGV